MTTLTTPAYWVSDPVSAPLSLATGNCFSFRRTPQVQSSCGWMPLLPLPVVEDWASIPNCGPQSPRGHDRLVALPKFVEVEIWSRRYPLAWQSFGAPEIRLMSIGPSRQCYFANLVLSKEQKYHKTHLLIRYKLSIKERKFEFWYSQGLEEISS